MSKRILYQLEQQRVPLVEQRKYCQMLHLQRSLKVSLNNREKIKKRKTERRERKLFSETIKAKFKTNKNQFTTSEKVEKIFIKRMIKILSLQPLVKKKKKKKLRD